MARAATDHGLMRQLGLPQWFRISLLEMYAVDRPRLRAMLLKWEATAAIDPQGFAETVSLIDQKYKRDMAALYERRKERDALEG